MENSSVHVPAGWYPDPVGRNEYRYWDGSAWTDNVANGGNTSIDAVVEVPEISRQQSEGKLPARGCWSTWRGDHSRSGCATHAIDRPSRILWSVPLKGGVTASVAEDGAIYVSVTGWKSALYAFSPDGSELWQLQNPSQGLGITPGVSLTRDRTAYFLRQNARSMGMTDVVAFAPNGHVDWAVEVDGMASGVAAIGPAGEVLVTTSSGLFEISPAGELQRRTWFKTLLGAIGIWTKVQHASPAVSPDGTHVVVSLGKSHWGSLDVASGEFRWLKSFSGWKTQTSPVALPDGGVIVRQGGNYRLLNESGELVSGRHSDSGDATGSDLPPVLLPDGSIAYRSGHKLVSQVRGKESMLLKTANGDPLGDCTGAILTSTVDGLLSISAGGEEGWRSDLAPHCDLLAPGPAGTLLVRSEGALVCVGS